PEKCDGFPEIYAQVSYALDFINDIFNGGSNNNVKEFLTFGPEVLRVWEEAVAMSM
ncbi:hypothetical protein L914_12008, partial [Phytophthora nicotianae]